MELNFSWIKNGGRQSSAIQAVRRLQQARREQNAQGAQNHDERDTGHGRAAGNLDILEGALALARKGFEVIPIWGVVDGHCQCGRTDCTAPGKHPQLSDWPNRCSDDEGQIRGWFSREKATNVGVVTGKPSGLWVLDVDPQNGGLESLEKLEQQHGALPPTLEVKTGGGGKHLYFMLPPGIEVRGRIGMCPGIDVRGQGGQVVAPPSRHKSGTTYTFANDLDPVAAPAWLLNMIGLKSDRGKQSRRKHQLLSLARSDADPERIIEGARNDHLTSLAGSMVNRGFSEEAVLAALLAENLNRCVPPLDDGEVEKITRSVCLYRPALHPPWPAPMGENALRGIAGDYVRLVEPHSEADPVAILVQFLVLFGNVIGRSPHFVVESTRHGANLYVGIVGDTSTGRKGTSLDRANDPTARADPEWRGRRKAGLSSGEGLIWAVRDAIYQEKPVKEGGKPTGQYERVRVDEGVADKRLLVVEAEFASALKVMSRQGNTLSPVLRSAWDGAPLQIMTKNQPAEARESHISVVGHVTKEELLSSLPPSELGNGLTNRFLWVCARRSKSLPDGGTVPQSELSAIVDRVRHAIEHARSVERVDRDESAKDLWHDIYGDLTRGRPGRLGAATSRAPAQVLRLALIYALLDCSGVIGQDHLRAALAVWDYCLDSARHIFGFSVGNTLADKIYQGLLRAEQGLTRTQIQQLIGRNYESEAITIALTSLLRAGFVDVRSADSVTGKGRPAEVWSVAVRRADTN